MRRAVLGVMWMILAAAVPAAAQPAAPAAAGAPIVYRVTFPEPEHHWLQVEVTFPGVGNQPVQARMSRSSPGRYAVHEFAKNVFWLEAFDGKGQRLTPTRPDVDVWSVAGHDGTVRIVYKIFGDFADGTYMGVDTTHAHMNMPATFMWASGLEMRPIRITFAAPPALNWKIGTQLMPTGEPQTFTAPNLQYFMDSPTELTDAVVSSFSVPNSDGTPANFRLFVHTDASQADVDALAVMVRQLVREHMAVYGEFPKYEPAAYTFLLDYAPWSDGDGMEHRNSTSISSPGLSLKTEQGRRQALSTISHEFFHNWNVERIRPAGIEPFDFTRENITCCLWLAEGFTQYYGPLLLRRAGLGQQVPTGAAIAIMNGSGREVRSAVQMSEHAPFADAGVANDMDDRSRTFISYYTYGSAIALALDLSLREKSAGKISLDDFMRRLWQNYGKVPDPRPGYVAKPYTLKNLRDELAALTSDRAFADAFFDKYVEGRDVPDYARLLAAVGYVLRSNGGDSGWIGNVAVAAVDTPAGPGLSVGMGGGRGGGGRVTPVPFGTPLYAAGVDEGDTILSIDDAPATPAGWAAISRKKPGDSVKLAIRRRDGKTATTTVTVKANPSLEIVPAENAGQTLTDAQRAMRDAWLGTKVK